YARIIAIQQLTATVEMIAHYDISPICDIAAVRDLPTISNPIIADDVPVDLECHRTVGVIRIGSIKTIDSISSRVGHRLHSSIRNPAKDVLEHVVELEARIQSVVALATHDVKAITIFLTDSVDCTVI